MNFRSETQSNVTSMRLICFLVSLLPVYARIDTSPEFSKWLLERFLVNYPDQCNLGRNRDLYSQSYRLYLVSYQNCIRVRPHPPLLPRSSLRPLPFPALRRRFTRQARPDPASHANPVDEDRQVIESVMEDGVRVTISGQEMVRVLRRLLNMLEDSPGYRSKGRSVRNRASAKRGRASEPELLLAPQPLMHSLFIGKSDQNVWEAADSREEPTSELGADLEPRKEPTWNPRQPPLDGKQNEILESPVRPSPALDSKPEPSFWTSRQPALGFRPDRTLQTSQSKSFRRKPFRTISPPVPSIAPIQPTTPSTTTPVPIPPSTTTPSTTRPAPSSTTTRPLSPEAACATKAEEAVRAYVGSPAHFDDFRSRVGCAERVYYFAIGG